MTDTASAPQGRRFYFVDEAGDATLFDSSGRVLVGEPGCSRFFMLGRAGRGRAGEAPGI